jgi:enoyl-CoA hydratase/carnithine racemase
MGGTYLVTRLVGPVRAAEILLTGKIFDAATAEKFGIVNGVFADDQLLTEVRRIAQDIATSAPIAVKAIKKGIQKAMHQSLEEMFDYDATAQALCFTSTDIREGVAAIQEKRKPRFTGK